MPKIAIDVIEQTKTESVVCYTKVHLTRTTDNHVYRFKKLHKDSSHYFYYYLLQSRVDFVWVIA